MSVTVITVVVFILYRLHKNKKLDSLDAFLGIVLFTVLYLITILFSMLVIHLVPREVSTVQSYDIVKIDAQLMVQGRSSYLSTDTVYHTMIETADGIATYDISNKEYDIKVFHSTEQPQLKIIITHSANKYIRLFTYKSIDEQKEYKIYTDISKI